MFAVVMTPLLLSLGVWQLGRAEDKQRILSQQSESDQSRAISFEELIEVDWQVASQDSQDKWSYKKVTVAGQYDPDRYFLLDNRTRNGQVGYEVLSVFLTYSGQPLLVNRGWIKAPPMRDQWPRVDNVVVEQPLEGTLYFPNKEAFTLGDAPMVKGWPKRIQKIDIQSLSEVLEGELYPFTLRLSDADQAGALRTGWKSVQMTPDKHIGYAFQWFGLAIVLVVMTFVAIRKIIKDDSKGENSPHG